MKALEQKRFWILAAILLVAAAIRLLHLTQPPFDFHPSRQYQNANNARYFAVRWGFELPPRQRENALENVLFMEPPLIELATAAAWRITGHESLLLPRLLSAAFWLAGAGILFVLASRALPVTAALLAAAIFALFPFGIQASRSLQPDPLMIFLLLLALERLHLFFLSDQRKHLIQGAVVAGLAMLVKPTCAIALAGAWLALMSHRHGWRKTLADPRSWLFGVIAVAPGLLYYGWSLTVGPGARLKGHAGHTFIPDLPLTAAYWKGWLVMIGRSAGILPFLVALFAAFRLNDRLFRALVLSLFASYLVYGLLFNYHIHTHDYYSLPLLIPVALALGAAIVRGSERLAGLDRAARWKLAGIAAAVPIFAGIAGLVLLKSVGLRNLDPSTKAALKQSLLLVGLSKKFNAFINPGYYKMQQKLTDHGKIGELVQHSGRTIHLTPDHGHSLRFNARISGAAWPDQPGIVAERMRGEPALSAPERFANEFAPRNPKYFIVTEFGDYDAQPDLKEFLEDRYPVLSHRTNRYLIFRLAGDSKRRMENPRTK